jgi:hypothetical protein
LIAFVKRNEDIIYNLPHYILPLYRLAGGVKVAEAYKTLLAACHSFENILPAFALAFADDNDKTRFYTVGVAHLGFERTPQKVGRGA